MLDAIRDFFERNIKGEDATGADAERRLQAATAALLVEMVRMDAEVKEDERTAVRRAIERKFGLRGEEATELLRLAEAEAGEATDYYQFTSLINQSFSPEQKERLIEQLWRVAYADGELHQYEEHLVRKIADLLYVPHNGFIAAKLRARNTGA